MEKLAVLTEGQKQLLVFLALSGGGAGAGAYLDKEKPVRGAMIGGMAGGMGHSATFLKPQMLDKMEPEAKLILAGTGALAGSTMGGFMGKNLYQALENLKDNPPALPQVGKTASETTGIDKTAIFPLLLGAGVMASGVAGQRGYTERGRSHDPVNNSKWDISAFADPAAWGQLGRNTASDVGLATKNTAGYGLGLVNTAAKSAVGADPDKSWWTNFTEPAGKFVDTQIKKVKGALGEAGTSAISKYAPIAIGGLGLLGAGLLAKSLFSGGGQGQAPQQYAFGAPHVQSPYLGGGPGWNAPQIDPNRWKVG